MDEQRFVHCYNSIKFKEKKEDPFSVAEVQRKSLALNFLASIYLNQDNGVTHYFLEKNLREYAEVVDNKDNESVNNYAESVLALLPNRNCDNQRTWKSNLSQIQLGDFVKPLPCSSDNDLKCSDIIQEELYCNDLKELLNERIHIPLEYNYVDEHTDHKTISTSEKKENEVEVKTLVPVVKDNINVKCHPKKDCDIKNENQNWKAVSFKTAREELYIQNCKKYGNNSTLSTNEESHSSVPIKRFLGTRKGGVFNKFQPPMRTKETALESMNDEKPVEDFLNEKLKNIDPKMIELIKSEIMDCGAKVTWDDIAGLELAKATIQEIVVWPMLRPDIFTGLRRPPKGILLFGPPGTGKTLIGKCIASQSFSTFFSISASSLTSKWIGDGEKMVRALFAVARCHQPAVVFIDEIDSLLSQRSDSEHESSRRLKTEFLVQLDGAGTAEDDRILIIGATNRPQELDEAARRRLVKRLYIPLPDQKARKQIILNLISREHHNLTEAEVDEISELCKGYSGADMKNLCQEASLGPIRSIPPLQIKDINADQVRPLNASDFKLALNRIKSSVSEEDLDVYVKWDYQYGCGSGTS